VEILSLVIVQTFNIFVDMDSLPGYKSKLYMGKFPTFLILVILSIALTAMSDDSTDCSVYSSQDADDFW
jgi:hypothetical protein